MARSSSPPPRIEDYGIIGDMRTCALVSKTASVDFLCWPKFDSPSIFARLLDTTKGATGHWSITPHIPLTSVVVKQNYRASTNILQTKFIHEEGVINITDFFALGLNDNPGRRAPGRSVLVRKVDCVRGRMPIGIEINSKLNYASDLGCTLVASTPSWEKGTYRQVLSHDGSSRQGTKPSLPEFLILYHSHKHIDQSPRMLLSTDQAGIQHAVFDLVEDDQVYMVMAEGVGSQYLTKELVARFEDETYEFWVDWIRSCSYRGRFQQEVERSLLILKLLTYEPTGAIVAAPTFSLPEAIGGGRQWDYRYSWVRDSSFTVYVFLKLGFTREAEAYINFIFRCIENWKRQLRSVEDKRTAKDDVSHLPLMFSVDGKTDLPEVEMNNFGGYLDSVPVRIGNAATEHVQLDIYGELMDAIYLYNKHCEPLSYKQWLTIRDLIDFVCTLTRTPDNSIWEVRGTRQHFTYSKMMLWVALDRAVRLTDKRPNLPCPNKLKWLSTRDALYEEVMSRGFNEKMNSFIQSYEASTVLDSAVLIAPLVFFISPNDPQFYGTLEAILKTPAKGGLTEAGFVYRYDTTKMDDGVGGREGAFVMCTLWLIEALARSGQYRRWYLDKAIGMFEQVTNFRNHLGMLSEEIAISGEQLGNTPQAFSHLAYVSAAINLEKALKHSRVI